jgi:hypothetical protein
MKDAPMRRSFPLSLVLGGSALTALIACPSRTPVGPPPVHVPPGCEQSQAGEYHHVGNPAFRYLAEDDGRNLSLTLVRNLLDGGVGETPDAGAVTLSLARTPEGFIGATRATGFSSAGTPCPVKFPTEVTACAPDTLTLRTQEKTSFNEECRPPPNAPPPVWVEQVLRRGPPPPPAPRAEDGGPGAGDAGVPDAGASPADAGPPDDGGLRPPAAPAPRRP